MWRVNLDHEFLFFDELQQCEKLKGICSTFGTLFFKNERNMFGCFFSNTLKNCYTLGTRVLRLVLKSGTHFGGWKFDLFEEVQHGWK